MGQGLLCSCTAAFTEQAIEDQQGPAPCEFAVFLYVQEPLLLLQHLTKLVLQYRARLSCNAAFRASSGKEKAKRQKDAELTLRRVLTMDPTDGRAYVTLGKLLLQQKRIEEARKLYDDGAAATGTTAHQ